MAAYSTLDTKRDSEAVHPITLFDSITAGIVIVMGWLVAGLFDVGRLEGAVDSVLAEWKLPITISEKVKPLKPHRLSEMGALRSEYKYCSSATECLRLLTHTCLQIL
jgi:hypothetical protein